MEEQCHSNWDRQGAATHSLTHFTSLTHSHTHSHTCPTPSIQLITRSHSLVTHHSHHHSLILTHGLTGRGGGRTNKQDLAVEVDLISVKYKWLKKGPASFPLFNWNITFALFYVGVSFYVYTHCFKETTLPLPTHGLHPLNPYLLFTLTVVIYVNI